MRKAEREKARADDEVRLFLGHWSYLCQVSGEASVVQPRGFSGTANPALGAGELGATRPLEAEGFPQLVASFLAAL